MTDPTTEAADALCTAGFHTALIIPTDAGAWAAQDGRQVILLYSDRDVLAGRAWQAIGRVGTVSRVVLGAGAQDAAETVLGALADIDPGPVLPFERQVQNAAHERRMMELT